MAVIHAFRAHREKMMMRSSKRKKKREGTRIGTLVFIFPSKNEKTKIEISRLAPLQRLVQIFKLDFDWKLIGLLFQATKQKGQARSKGGR